MCRHRNSPACLLLLVREVGGAGDAIWLRDRSRVVITVDGFTNPLAELLANVNGDGVAKEVPKLEISRRGLDDHTRRRPSVGLPAHLLIGIGIDDQGKDTGGIFEFAATVAAYRFADGAALDVHIVPVFGGRDRVGDHALGVVEPVTGRY